MFPFGNGEFRLPFLSLFYCPVLSSRLKREGKGRGGKEIEPSPKQEKRSPKKEFFKLLFLKQVLKYRRGQDCLQKKVNETLIPGIPRPRPSLELQEGDEKGEKGKDEIARGIREEKKDCSFWAKVDWKRDTGTKKAQSPFLPFLRSPKYFPFPTVHLSRKNFSLVSKVNAISDSTKNTAFFQGMLTKKEGFFLIWRLISPPWLAGQLRDDATTLFFRLFLYRCGKHSFPSSSPQAINNLANHPKRSLENRGVGVTFRKKSVAKMHFLSFYHLSYWRNWPIFKRRTRHKQCCQVL